MRRIWPPQFARGASRLGRVCLFALSPLVGAVVPLVAVPAIMSQYGAGGWSAVAIGQSVGAAAAVVVEMGWALTGPQKVALRPDRQLYFESLMIRGLMLVPSGLVAFIAAAIISRDHVVVAGITAVAYAAFGLSGGWYFIGRGRPGALLVGDALPRALFAVAGAMLIHAGSPLIANPILILCGALLCPWSALLLADRSTPLAVPGVPHLAMLVKAQKHAMPSRILSATYIALPVAIVGIAMPSAVATFAAAERLMRMGLTALQAVPNSLQRWVGAAHSARLMRFRVKTALILNAFLGVFACAVWLALSGPVSEMLFGEEVAVGGPLAMLAGTVVFLTCVSRATGNIALVRLDKVNVIATSALVGLLIGVPAIFLLARLYGGPGAMAGEVLAEASVLLVQSVGIWRFFSNQTRPPR